MQLPGLEALYDDFKAKGIDEVYCLSVNDSFVMNAWAKELEIENVKMIPDGSGEFTRDMNMLVWKPAQNFGYRSWRYAMVINDMEVEKLWREDGINQMGLGGMSPKTLGMPGIWPILAPSCSIARWCGSVGSWLSPLSCASITCWWLCAIASSN